MNKSNADRWKNDALDFVFEALAASDTLTSKLIYKGARVLNKRLGSEPRQSLDIDSNITAEFAAQYPDLHDQKEELQTELRIALEQYLNAQSEVIYQLEGVRVRVRPSPGGHRHGWNAFEVRLNILDLRQPGTLGFPALEIDIAAPEALGPNAISMLPVGENEVCAYTLERIAGEKPRAYLSSLPTYRQKLSRPGDAVRAKDLYDLARILRARPLTDHAFWSAAGAEFRLACQSMFVDCTGLESFCEAAPVARATYESEATIPKNISFD